MTKFPRLEMLRAERERQVREIQAPVRFQLDQSQARAGQLADSLRSLERIVGSEIGKHVIEMITDRLGHEVRKVVYDAWTQAGGKPGANVTVTLSGETLRFMDPRSLERQLLDRYVGEAIPRVSLRAHRRPEESVTVLDVRVPEFGIRQLATEH